ncbi:hypothetical protein YC2023_107350 [Brassica napus]
MSLLQIQLQIFETHNDSEPPKRSHMSLSPYTKFNTIKQSRPKTPHSFGEQTLSQDIFPPLRVQSFCPEKGGYEASEELRDTSQEETLGPNQVLSPKMKQSVDHSRSQNTQVFRDYFMYGGSSQSSIVASVTPPFSRINTAILSPSSSSHARQWYRLCLAVVSLLLRFIPTFLRIEALLFPLQCKQALDCSPFVCGLRIGGFGLLGALLQFLLLGSALSGGVTALARLVETAPMLLLLDEFLKS